MAQEDKTKEEFTEEIRLLQKRIAELEKLDSERKQAEEHTKKQSEFVETVINSLQYPFYVIGTDYTIILSNKAAKTRDVSEGGRCYQVTHHCQEPCSSEHVCPLKEVIRTGKPTVTEHIHFDNGGNCRNFEVHGDPILDKEGRVIQMIEYSIDITEREKMKKEAQKRLRELEVFYKASIGREERILVLKKEIEMFKKELGK